MEALQERIARLEKESKKLEPNPIERANTRNQIVAYGDNFLDTINNIPAYTSDFKDADKLASEIFEDTPTAVENLVQVIQRDVDNAGLKPASPGHLGYIPGGGIYYSALGDYLADIGNAYAGIYFAGPGAVQMENGLLNWLSSIIGYPNETGGNLTSGGSMANLIAITTARDAHFKNASEYNNAVIYLSEHTHHCAKKALNIVGMGNCRVRHIPLNASFQVNTEILEELITTDINEGFTPWMVIGNAGTTDVGAIDPLNEMADICNKHKLWFHVDAAYGGFFILTEEGKKKLSGIDRSDSIVLDPHKGLFLPYGLGAVLIKDKKLMMKSHAYEANYMQDAAEDHVLSPAEVSPELTKPFRGLRLWLPLKLYGLAPFKACIQEKLELTKYFYQEIQKIPGFSVGPEPELSVTTFRYIPENGDANTFNQNLIKAIHKDGRVFLSSTLLKGEFTLRLAILSFRTHKDTIDLTLTLLKELVTDMNKS